MPRRVGVGLRVDQTECMPLLSDAIHSRASVLRPLIYVLWMAALISRLRSMGLSRPLPFRSLSA